MVQIHFTMESLLHSPDNMIEYGGDWRRYSSPCPTQQCLPKPLKNTPKIEVSIIHTVQVNIG